MLSPEESIYTLAKSSITEAIQLIQKHSPDPDTLLASMKEATEQLCETQMEAERCKKALDNTQNFIKSNDDPERTIDDISEIYNTELNRLPFNLRNTQHDFYKEVLYLIGEDVEEQDVSRQSYMDESIMCTNVISVPNDPITKGPIRNACKNTVCKHIYDLDSIKIYIASRRKGKACCPYVGCVNSNICLADIVPENNFHNI